METFRRWVRHPIWSWKLRRLLKRENELYEQLSRDMLEIYGLIDQIAVIGEETDEGTAPPPEGRG